MEPKAWIGCDNMVEIRDSPDVPTKFTGFLRQSSEYPGLRALKIQLKFIWQIGIWNER